MLEELIEKKNTLFKRINELREENNNPDVEWTSEKQANWDELNADYDRVCEEIAREQRFDEVKTRQETQGTDGVSAAELASADYAAHKRRKDPDAVTEEDRALAMEAWVAERRGLELTDRHKEAKSKISYGRQTSIDIPMLRGPEFNMLRNRQEEQRTTYYTSTNASYGGSQIPQGFVNNLELALEAFGGLRRAVTVLRTATGNDIKAPYLDDTNVGELVDEYQDSDDSGTNEANLQPSAVTFSAYKISSKLIKVTHELMVDSAFNMVNLLGQLCGERIARKIAALLITGTGSSQHNGLAAAGTSGKTAASATAVTANEIIDLLHSVDPAYRVAAFNCSWVMEDATAKAVRKLKDSDGQYIWQPGMQAGLPDVLFGYPVIIDQDCATIAASAKPIFFGALKKHVLREVAEVRIRHLVERYAELDLEAFVGFHRSDCELMDAGTNPVKYMTMAAS